MIREGEDEVGDGRLRRNESSDGEKKGRWNIWCTWFVIAEFKFVDINEESTI